MFFFLSYKLEIIFEIKIVVCMFFFFIVWVFFILDFVGVVYIDIVIDIFSLM